MTGKLAALALLCGLLLPPGQALADGPIRPGRYEGFSLAVGPGGEVAGYFRQQQGEGVVKSCAFFLSGHQANGGRIAVLTWSRQVFPGTLAATDGGVVLTVPRAGLHPGCGLVLPPAISEGLELSLVSREHWMDLRRVTTSGAVLRAAPGAGAKRVARLAAGEVLAVRARRGGWLQVDDLQSGHRATGWVPASATEALMPPK